MYKHSSLKRPGKVALASLVLSALLTTNASAWSEHTLISYPVLKTMPAVADAPAVKVETLEEFLTAEQNGLETFLANDEAWLRENDSYYHPLPDAIAFKAGGDTADIALRFMHAIRVNPESRMQPFVQLLPGQDTQGRRRMASSEVSVFKDLKYYDRMTFVELKPGEMVSPMDVVLTGNDEPDNGLDIGLLEDSNTETGKQYGFGVQAFGNPTLEYGTQAPFHMGLYHESSIIYALAPYFHDTFPSYRVHTLKALSEYAFKTGHDYWGWRFMGIGLHYIGDISQPYHSTLMPGVSTFSGLWTNMKDVAGFPQGKNDAIQLLSNRHMVIEKYQEVITKDAYKRNDFSSPIFTALETVGDVPEYDENTFVEVFANKSGDKADELAECLETWVPEKLVNDPSFELSGTEEADNIVPMIRAEFGEEGINAMSSMLAELMADHSSNTRSYVQSILSNAAVSTTAKTAK